MVQAPLLNLQQASLLPKKELAQPAKIANLIHQICYVTRLFTNSTDPHELHCALSVILKLLLTQYPRNHASELISDPQACNTKLDSLSCTVN